MKRLRLILLTALLVLVAHHQWNERSRHVRWDAPLFIAIYPVAGDASVATARAMDRLDAAGLAPINTYLAQQGAHYGIDLQRPFYIEIGRPPTSVPPPPPVDGHFLQRIAWVAQVRWWRWRFDDQGLDPDIIVLARYFDPDANPVLPHSTGLQPVRLVIANLYAGARWQGSNQVVLLHEILHTLGATDKYDLANGRPLYPGGYAEPDRDPRYPQRYAELMAGRIPVGPDQAIQADSLSSTRIGPETARELNWMRR